MVAKGEIRRKGRVLKAAMARAQDGRLSFDCARWRFLHSLGYSLPKWVGGDMFVLPDSDPRNGHQGPQLTRVGSPFTLARFWGNLAKQRRYWSLA